MDLISEKWLPVTLSSGKKTKISQAIKESAEWI